MTIIETVLVFAGIPLGALALVAVIVLGPGAAKAPRYRPGSAWEFEPVWYLPHPDHEGPVSAAAFQPGTRAPLTAGTGASATPTGGASGEW